MTKRQFELTEKEANRLRQAEMQSQSWHERQRLQTIRLYGTGMATRDILEAFSCSQRSIQPWINSYQENGLLGLQSDCDGQTS